MFNKRWARLTNPQLTNRATPNSATEAVCCSYKPPFVSIFYLILISIGMSGCYFVRFLLFCILLQNGAHKFWNNMKCLIMKAWKGVALYQNEAITWIQTFTFYWEGSHCTPWSAYCPGDEHHGYFGKIEGGKIAVSIVILQVMRIPFW